MAVAAQAPAGRWQWQPRWAMVVFVVVLLAANGVLFTWLATATTGTGTGGGHRGSAGGWGSAYRDLTVVLRDFEEFEHGVAEALHHYCHSLPGVEVVVAGDRVPYPAIKLPRPSRCSARIVDLSFRAGHPDGQGDEVLGRRFVAFAPDTLLPSAATMGELRRLAGAAAAGPSGTIALGVVGHARCLEADYSRREWTLSLSPHVRPRDALVDACPYTEDEAVVMMRADTLRRFNWRRYRPLQLGLLLEAAAAGVPVLRLVGHAVPTRGLGVFKSSHTLDKHRRAAAHRRQHLLSLFGIKLIQRPDHPPEWHGCRRDTPRCFGTILHDRPEYLAQGKWTPPCCLDKLRRTARYVFETLDRQHARYWLEGGSLLGAARHGDIIKWDYDVDVGIWQDDIELVTELREAKAKGRVSANGFVWERAKEGNFFRVQYSKINHLHVDIFPFYETSDGVMTKDTWMGTHVQDMEFPSHFLKPLARIPFVGASVRAPNHHRDFLELKFGAGAIEHPQYPGAEPT